MSEQSGGPGWWLASDGRWYPPEQTSSTPTPEPTESPVPWWKRRVPLWALILAGLIGIAVGAGSAPDSEETRAASSERETTTTGERTTTTVKRTTTTTEPTTTTTTTPPTTTTTTPPVPVEVARFEGSADTQTASFTVEGTWTMQAIVNGGAGLLVELHEDITGEMVDYLDFDEGDQTSQFRSGGTYFLDISQYGSSYTIIIVDQPG